MISAEEDALQAAFPVFARPKAPSDALSDHLVSVVERSLERFPDLDPDKSRLVTPPDAFIDYYLVAGRTALAQFDPRGSGGITHVAHAASARSVGTSFRGTGRVEVNGLLPIDVTDARIVLRDGRVIPAPAPFGVYSVLVTFREAGDLPATLDFTKNGQAISLHIPGADDELLTLKSPPPHLKPER
jgi:hypothetical protein